MYQFTYKLTDDEFWEFNRYHMLNSPVGKKALRSLRLLLPSVFAILLLITLFRIEDSRTIANRMIVYAAISVIWTFVAKPLNLALLKSKFTTLKKNGKLPYDRDVSIRFDDDCIMETTKEIEMKVKYTKIEGVFEGKNAFYIYNEPHRAFIIPFSAIESVEQRDAFRAFIHAKAAQAKAASQVNQPIE